MPLDRRKENQSHRPHRLHRRTILKAVQRFAAHWERHPRDGPQLLRLRFDVRDHLRNVQGLCQPSRPIGVEVRRRRRLATQSRRGYRNLLQRNCSAKLIVLDKGKHATTFGRTRIQGASNLREDAWGARNHRRRPRFRLGIGPKLLLDSELAYQTSLTPIWDALSRKRILALDPTTEWG